MSFLNRLNEVTKPKLHTARIDLGFGDGEETLYFRSLSYEERQKIFGARSKDDGTLDVRDKGLFLAAELIAASLCHEDGSNVVTIEAARKWDSELLDRLSAEAMKILTPKATEENPSSGKSESGSPLP